MTWLEKQEGNVQQFEKVDTTFINEDTGEMHCAVCNASEFTRRNSSASLLGWIRQVDALEKFTERHLHGMVI